MGGESGWGNTPALLALAGEEFGMTETAKVQTKPLMQLKLVAGRRPGLIRFRAVFWRMKLFGGSAELLPGACAAR